MPYAPLKGVRVLDLSRILAGPWATQNLADLGAEVSKIEKPGSGDDTHGWGPPFVEGADGFRESTYFLSCNHGKKISSIDLASPEGAEQIRTLAAKADVLVENFKVGALKRHGLDYESLSRTNPRLIYCSITGFGQTGPYAQRPGYDALIQAMGGLMSITGVPDGSPGAGPQKVGVAIIDILSGLYATSAILAALHERHTSGRGRHIDISLLHVQIAALANQAAAYLLAGQVPGRLGSAHPSIVPYQPFATSDGHVLLAVANDSQYAAFCAAAGLGPDARACATNESRVRERAKLLPLLTHSLSAKSTMEWIALGERHGFPCGPINDIAQVFADPHVKATGIVVEAEHPKLGRIRRVRNPMV